METKHKTVLLQQTIAGLQPIIAGQYLDATLGVGGHSKELLSYLPEGRLTAFDVDQMAISRFRNYLLSELHYIERQPNIFELGKKQVVLINDNFARLDHYIKEPLNGIIADLGFATDQLDSVPGLSFLKDEELDMRMDGSLTVKALDLLNGLYIGELETLFVKFGDVSFAKKLAKDIAKIRTEQPITRTTQLNTIISKIVPFSLRKGDNKHPEAKVYQALRIAVNDERNSLQKFLTFGFNMLGSGGKFAVISFHSGEDRIVKNLFRDLVSEEKAKHVAKRIKPGADEIAENNNSRSAKLRILEKI